MTAGRIILDMPNPAIDKDGKPYSKAKLYFYQNGTTILQDVFSDSTLATVLVNPLVSDSSGRFPEVWGDTANVYSVKWTDSGDALIYTFDAIQPLATSGVTADGAGVNASAFRTALGLGTAALADTGTAAHTLGFLDTANVHTGIDNFQNGLKIANLPAGYAGIPSAAQNGAYTFALTDVGDGVFHTSATAHTWTIPPNSSVAFNQGDAIYLRNIGTATVTIARGVGVSLRIAGSASSANVALASYGAATLIYDGTDQWCIIGAGIS